MRAVVAGEVRGIFFSEDRKYADVNVLSEGSMNSDRLWCFADLAGLDGLKVGDVIEADVNVKAKLSKGGAAYLASQLKGFEVVVSSGKSLSVAG